MSIRDTVRFRWWKNDFDSLLAAGALLRLSTLRFGNDHTEGLSRNKPTPFAHVADNELAVGLFVDYLSHSPVWKNSLIIIVEDDAPAVPIWRCMNNTPDHPSFNVRPCQVDLNSKNLAENIWQKKSEQFDFTKEDMISDAEFNEVIWRAVKGLDSPCPPTVHAAFFMPVDEEDDE